MFRFFLLVILAFNANAHSLRNGPPLGENIVGGTPATIEEYPYQVAVVQANQLWCAGSIITPSDVLSAAHCVVYAISPLVVHAGSAYWAQPGSVHQVVSNATYGTEPNTDISVLRVKERFVYDQTRQPIRLFSTGDVVPNGQLGTVAGWGLNKDSDESGALNQLSAVQVPMIDRYQCDKDYDGTAIGRVLPGEICAGSYGKGPCRGDSGSALVYNGQQVGIVSMGQGCASLQYPGIYTDVAYYSKWIAAQITPEN